MGQLASNTDSEDIKHMDIYTLIPLVKILTISQIALIIFFLIMIYLVKFYYFFREKQTIKRMQLVEQILISHCQKQEPLSSPSIKLIKASISDVLKRLDDIEKKYELSKNIQFFKEQLSKAVLIPVARKWALSRRWYKRFDATLCYLHGFDSQDEENLLKLLKDPSMLIAVNAAEVVITFNHAALINEMISVFSQGRRLQQSLTVEIIGKINVDISQHLLKRLETEDDLYTKIFCYRLLGEYPQKQIAPCAIDDLKLDSVDLKITLINYFLHCHDSAKNEIIYALADDPNKAVVAAVAKALGMIHTETSKQILAKLLHSSDWWIRQNTAVALYQLGSPGITILKGQKPDEDKFAYESAQAVLIERENLC